MKAIRVDVVGIKAAAGFVNIFNPQKIAVGGAVLARAPDSGEYILGT